MGNSAFKAMVIAAFALPAAALAGKPAPVADCNFAYAGKADAGQFAINWEPMCQALNAGLKGEAITIKEMVVRASQTNRKQDVCAKYRFVGEPEPDGAIRVRSAGMQTTPGGKCDGERDTPKHREQPAQSPDFKDARMNGLAKRTLKGRGWRAGRFDQLIIVASYQSDNDPERALPLITRIVKGEGRGNQWAIKSYEYICDEAGRNPGIPACADLETDQGGMKLASASTSTSALRSASTFEASSTLSSASSLQSSSQTGWSNYKILNPSKTNSQRLVEVTYHYQDGAGTQVDFTWPGYCTNDDLLILSAKQTFQHSTGKNFYNCAAPPGGQCF